MKRKRTVAIGDIHGCSKSLSSLLEKVNLDENTTVIFMGDYCDRGADSKGVLDLVMQLQSEGHVCLKGNHEQMLLDAATSGIDEDSLLFEENGGDVTLENFGIEDVSQIPVEYLNFISSLPLYWQNDTNIFVHASLPCELKEPISARHRHEMLWRRTTWTDPVFLQGKRLVTGHCIKSLQEIRISLKTSHVFTDNGVCLGAGYKGGSKGNLVAIDLESQELWQQPCLDLAPVDLY